MIPATTRKGVSASASFGSLDQSKFDSWLDVVSCAEWIDLAKIRWQNVNVEINEGNDAMMSKSAKLCVD